MSGGKRCSNSITNGLGCIGNCILRTIRKLLTTQCAISRRKLKDMKELFTYRCHYGSMLLIMEMLYPS
ncbi:hypothetical protein ATCV1_z665R [Acanthocystis turfacea chlorella virus 1]|uniref:Uncharacterized protein z665R n=1 Tax=Chlorovirus heliozoae TaxID=322019 RepID=A7K9S5_9PHYC|nr:hypothetical protein ATCV1_z665R [Acanthocystis turfacea chlorella virus 1]ABT16799.1 hypothetical protein ATCV1_z665R [Acanthocystis turfacea chlorella virus 1]